MLPARGRIGIPGFVQMFWANDSDLNAKIVSLAGFSWCAGPWQNHCRRVWGRIGLGFWAVFERRSAKSRKLIEVAAAVLPPEGDRSLPPRHRAMCFGPVPSIIVGGDIPGVVQAVASSVLVVTWESASTAWTRVGNGGPRPIRRPVQPQQRVHSTEWLVGQNSHRLAPPVDLPVQSVTGAAYVGFLPAAHLKTGVAGGGHRSP